MPWSARSSRLGPRHQDQGLAGQRGDHRSRTGLCAFAHRWTVQAPQGRGLGYTTQHPGAHLRRLARSAPGFFEIDMVEHCGGVKTEGEFVHTLTMTDIASGWTE